MTDDQRGPRPAPDVIEPGVPATDEVRDEQLRTGEISEGPLPPEDEPQAVDEWGTTKAEERANEPLGMRLEREEPQAPAAGRTGGQVSGTGRVLQPDDSGGALDTEKDEVGELDVEQDDTLSAEEAAVRVRDDAPGGTYDTDPGYIED